MCDSKTEKSKLLMRLLDTHAKLTLGNFWVLEKCIPALWFKFSLTVAHSCRHLLAIGRKQRIKYPSGVYTINPGNQGNVKTYCDMERDGGGWTLLVTSHTNTWKANNVRRRFEDNPRLDGDFSILYKADAIKDSTKVEGDSFEYRIEAHEFGKLCSSFSSSLFFFFPSL